MSNYIPLYPKTVKDLATKLEALNSIFDNDSDIEVDLIEANYVGENLGKFVFHTTENLWVFYLNNEFDKEHHV